MVLSSTTLWLSPLAVAMDEFKGDSSMDTNKFLLFVTCLVVLESKYHEYSNDISHR
jgi:hypothetical protein